MGLTDSIRGLLGRSTSIPAPLPLVDNLWPFANIGGQVYPFGLEQTLVGQNEEIDAGFAGYAGAFKGNGIVYACLAARSLLFSEARFQFQRLEKGRPGDLFGTPALDILERPWPGATTGDMLSRMELHNGLAGNAFITRRRGRLVMMRPDWVSIVLGSPTDDEVEAVDLEAEVLGYIYYPGGRYSGRDPVPLLREEVAHYAPMPDPLASYRGMSWLTPIVRDILGDNAATSHKLNFFRNGATPNMVVKRPDAPAGPAFKEWVEMMEQRHAGAANAYKTLYLTAGADANVVGRDLAQLEFKVTQGAGETRIAAAAGMHPAIIGLSEGLQGASLNAGNFGAARRLTADKGLWPFWRNAAGSLETIVPPPSGARLWIDARDIPLLREDRKDAADIQQIKAATIRTLVDAGYKPETVVRAVESENMSLLQHSGLYSVQLQPPGTQTPEPTTPPPGAKPVAPKKPTPRSTADGPA